MNLRRELTDTASYRSILLYNPGTIKTQVLERHHGSLGLVKMDTTGGYVPSTGLNGISESQEPIFNIERVQLQFSLSSDFVAAQVANNVLILALTTGRIMRIDLENAADIDGQP